MVLRPIISLFDMRMMMETFFAVLARQAYIHVEFELVRDVVEHSLFTLSKIRLLYVFCQLT